jgi:hypothetical protein
LLGSPFGHRGDPTPGQRAMHEGIAFNAETGTPVVAAADRVVLATAYQGDFGNMIGVDHGDGLTTRYARLSRMSVKPGSVVKRGEAIRGRQHGPHHRSAPAFRGAHAGRRAKSGALPQARRGIRAAQAALRRSAKPDPGRRRPRPAC